ncbi:MAG TPA: DUF1343 domain-containing protein [Terriglobales bacterium]|nr:DUF1343 domain-containing protein [Terriglobales bacterium]
MQTGIDVLVAANFEPLRRGRPRTRLGLLTNHTGMDSGGRRTIDLLAGAPGISLAAIFSPEHGPAGALDTVDIPDSRDATTGIPIYGVYGKTEAQRRPRPELLRDLHAIVIDLQDAGAAFYTYATTMAYFLEAAAQAGTEVFVLDRPNPITGSMVQGPVSDATRSDFIRYHPLPVRHGMTMGELALLYNHERKIGARLRVVPMKGWRRREWYDATGLPWVPPSPNLRTLTQATLYPGVALLERTNVSVGRGTEMPFEVVGAPWISGNALAAFLNRRRIPGVRFVSVEFTPSSSTHAKQRCGGVKIVIVDREGLDSPLLGGELAAALGKLYPKEFEIQRVNDLLANQMTFKALLAGEDPRRISRQWRGPLTGFRKLRRRYLLYK